MTTCARLAGGWLTRLQPFALAALLGLTVAGTVSAQTADNVLVVANAASALSTEIADYYVQARHVPADQVLRLQLPVAEEIIRERYTAAIESAVGQWLTSHAAQDRILYIVLTKDVPFRIIGTGGVNGTVASVDSELALLYRKLVGISAAASGPVKNPYFAGDGGLEAAKPFTHRMFDLYLVTRLDGYTVADVKGLIDRGMAPSREGVVVLDGRLESIQSLGNRWLIGGATALKKMPGGEERTVLDTSAKVLEQPSALGYYAWGSSDPAQKGRHPGVTFVPGAIGGEFVSTDARTFQEPPADWRVNDRPYRGSQQSLIGDLIRDGITGVAGYVAEPFIGSTVRPDILFPAYLAGYNLAEAFYLAMPSIGWTAVVIGDPLCAPFRTDQVADADLNPGSDPATDMPRFLSERRLKTLMADGAKAEAARLFARAEARVGAGDAQTARQLLEEATVSDDTFTEAHFRLAALYGQARMWDATVVRLKRVVALDPMHTTAMNDLAYILAVAKQAPEEALPYAKRAFLQPDAGPEVADTLAWVHHLLGQDVEAQTFILQALRRLPANADIQLHGAAILLATRNIDAAAAAMTNALRLNPALAEQPDVKELQDKITALK